MSDYRRLISYIYEYEGKEKGKNVGFVKLEAKNGQCRLNVNVKRIYVGGNAIGVYLLGKEGRKTFLGNMFVRNGNGEFRTTVDAENVENGGESLDTYFGLAVHDVKNSWRSYMTVWEDTAVSVQAAETEVKNDKATGPVAQDILPGSESISNVRAVSSIVHEIEEEIAREEENTVLAAAETGENTVTDAVNVEETSAFGEVQPDEANEPATTTSMESDAPNTMPPAESGDTPMLSPELENPEVIKYLQETEELPADAEKIWQELRKSYPKIQPFDYNGESEVLTIRPQDIGRLPRENWVYGNNSFLLHGYYNFRYLILVRLNNADGVPRYLIGVPGHYYSNEKYMATMFGFPNFVLSKKQPPNDGRFGYWYTDIKMR